MNSLLSFVLMAVVALTSAPPRLHLVGDSTLADKPRDTPNPETGWGMPLRRFFKDSAQIVNHAINGRSTKSYIAEGTWAKVMADVHPGDWVLIQFGHNDAKEDDSTRFAAARGAYSENLHRMIRDVRAKGANPLLATSVARRRWNAKHEFYDAHGDYPPAMRDVAAADKVPLLEMHKLSMAVVAAQGEEGSIKMFLHYPPGMYARKPEGYKDDTHFSEYGALRMAELAVQEMLRLQLPIASWLKDD